MEGKNQRNAQNRRNSDFFDDAYFQQYRREEKRNTAGKRPVQDKSRPQQKKRRPASPQKRPPQKRAPQAREKAARPVSAPAVKRRKKPISRAALRLRRFLISFAVISAALAVAAALSLTVLFKTENIVVEGKTRYSSEEIIKFCTIKKGENIFLADKRKAEENIKTALPYIGEIDVAFSIPDSIVIRIADAKPAYQISVYDIYYLISPEGRILESASDKTEGIPTLEGVSLKSYELGGYVRFEDEMSGQILTQIADETSRLGIQDKITVIDITSAAKIKLLYDDRILILLGLPEAMNYKLRTALTVINERIDPNNSGIITGRLDVSICHETQRSYFNENEIYIPPSQQHKFPTETDPSGTDNSDNTDNTDSTDSTDITDSYDYGYDDETDP